MPTNTTVAPAEVFAIDLAQLAREVAMDILPLEDVLKLHQLSEDDWQELCLNPRFKTMIEGMVREWNSAGSVRERTRLKAATGVESQLEVFIRDIGDSSIPLGQRVEAAKFLARIGEIDGALTQGSQTAPFSISINIGDARPVEATVRRNPFTLDLGAIPEDAE